MALSNAVEYLQTIGLLEGRQTVGHSTIQVYQPLFPANSEQKITLPPVSQSYANIIYQIGWSDTMPVNVFRQALETRGRTVFDVILTADFIREYYDMFVVITKPNTVITTIQNLTGLNQFFSMTVKYLSIESEADFKTAMALMNRGI